MKEYVLRSRIRLLVLCLLFVAVATPLILPEMIRDRAEPVFENPDDTIVGGAGSVDTFWTRYQNWEKNYISWGGDRSLLVGLTFNRGLSTEFVKAQGRARIDLVEGVVTVAVAGMEGEDLDVWLVDNIAGDGKSVMPESGDELLFAGTLFHEKDGSYLKAPLPPYSLTDFEVDMVVVTRNGQDPTESRVIYGSTHLFQRMYHYGNVNWTGDEQAPDNLAPLDGLSLALSKLAPNSVFAQGICPPTSIQAALINRGRELFFRETFDGNGRTCGTCHPEDNNFTIEPKFIATLPDNDPLFVAEFVPALSQNFEKPKLMRKVGLILENTNGFSDLVNNFTMRGVPHTLALGVALVPGSDGTAQPPNERTGWSGDGSPVDLTAIPPLLGTLRDFAVGAVTQHFPKTLARNPGGLNPDFRLPTQAELDALEAFQLSLGRQTEFPDLTTIELKDCIADRGRELFLGNGVGGTSCQTCHRNAGANANFGNMQNFNFNTNAEGILDQPGDIVDAPNNPPDDGFGNPGNGGFNTPVLVEAADTGPFFHNNSVETIEGAVAFYTGPNVNITIMDASQVRAIALFLRVINAHENLRSALVLEKKAQQFESQEKAKVNLLLSIAELEDAIEVLRCGFVHCDDVVPLIEEAIKLDLEAIAQDNHLKRIEIIERAKRIKERAQSLLICFNVSP